MVYTPRDVAPSARPPRDPTGAVVHSPRLIGRLKLRQLLFVLLLLLGIIPVMVGSVLLVRQNRDYLETQEKAALTGSAEALSRELNDDLAGVAHQAGQLGQGLLAYPGDGSLEARLREPWVVTYVQDFLRQNQPSLLALRVLDLDGAGVRFAPADLAPAAAAALDGAFEEARAAKGRSYRIAVLPGNQPTAAFAAVVESGGQTAVVELLARLRLLEAVFGREARVGESVFLLDKAGAVLWSQGSDPAMTKAVASSDLVRDFLHYPLSLSAEYPLEVGGHTQHMLGRVSPLEQTGWAVVMQRPSSAAFEFARRMVLNALLATGILVVMALFFAAFAARWISEPIQRLAETTHEIAAGKLGQRVALSGGGAEITSLAEDFNRMSGTLESYVAQLKEAASQNRELFISSLRAFAAAIDAKDPYTRGHSERVAAFSRTVARHLGLKEELQNRLWIGALLHDVGKIGIEDGILRKGGVLTSDEYDQMKQHTMIGAEILKPIGQLHDMIPIVRWHHEAWNGRGYPDGLRGEDIPVLARIVAVSDCFDAITTSRPYQRAYAPEFAVETITKLTGSRFDAKIVTAFLHAFQAGEIQAAREESEPVPAAAAVAQ